MNRALLILLLITAVSAQQTVHPNVAADKTAFRRMENLTGRPGRACPVPKDEVGAWLKKLSQHFRNFSNSYSKSFNGVHVKKGKLFDLHFRILIKTVLPNHFHFLIRIRDENKVKENLTGRPGRACPVPKDEVGVRLKNLSQHFSIFFNSYSKSFNGVHVKKGKLFDLHFRILIKTVLPNHFHFLIRIRDENKVKENLTGRLGPVRLKNLSQHFSNFFNSYSRSFSGLHGKKGKLFDLPFKRILFKTVLQPDRSKATCQVRTVKNGMIEND